MKADVGQSATIVRSAFEASDSFLGLLAALSSAVLLHLWLLLASLSDHVHARQPQGCSCGSAETGPGERLFKEAHASRLEPEAGAALHIKPELLFKLLLVFLSNGGRRGRVIGLISAETRPDCAAFLYHRCSHRSSWGKNNPKMLREECLTVKTNPLWVSFFFFRGEVGVSQRSLVGAFQILWRLTFASQLADSDI